MNSPYYVNTYQSVYKVAHCKHCNKIEEFDKAQYVWFIINYDVAYCTETCWLLEKDNVKVE